MDGMRLLRNESRRFSQRETASRAPNVKIKMADLAVPQFMPTFRLSKGRGLPRRTSSLFFSLFFVAKSPGLVFSTRRVVKNSPGLFRCDWPTVSSLLGAAPPKPLMQSAHRRIRSHFFLVVSKSEGNILLKAGTCLSLHPQKRPRGRNLRK